LENGVPSSLYLIRYFPALGDVKEYEQCVILNLLEGLYNM